MDNLALKLVLTPALIGAATLAGRRWGQSVGGWIVGLPLTTGPVAFFIALDHGAAFGAAAVVGSLVGAVAEAAFSVAYAWSAVRGPRLFPRLLDGWPPALLAGSAAYAATALVLQPFGLGPVALAVVVVAALVLSLWLMPAGGAGASAAEAPRWDLPARMVLATTVVLALTALAPWLGARLAGLLATYPLFAAILTAFGHGIQGPDAALGVLRGLLFGLFSFAGFCLVLALGLVPLGIAGAFAAAIAVALLVQGLALWRLRAPRPAGAP
jgi:hypothetical protein